MMLESSVVAAVLIAVAIYVLVRAPRVRGVTTVALAVLALVAVWRWTAWETASLVVHQQREHLASQLPASSKDDGYVSSDACRSCHPNQYESWHRSYHRTMTQAATPAAVLGDFRDVQVSEGGIDFHLQRRGEEFWFKQRPSGASADPSSWPDTQLVMTTGSHHYQVYWTSRGDDRSLIAFPLAYLKEAKRWIPREAALVIPPSQSQAVVVWNANCIRCHSTHAEPRVNLATDTADSQAAELGISCESCHGPGQQHVAANHNPARRYLLHLRGQADQTIVQPTRLTAERSSESCGQCHSISSTPQRDWWHGAWNRYRPGQALGDVQTVVRPNRQESLKDVKAELDQDPEYMRGRYWSDGMVRVIGREFNGMIESKCYRAGTLSCLSCHSMHDSDSNDQLAAGMETNRACLQCHSQVGANVARHTRHAEGSEASRCYNCHMPYTSYGLLKAARSHQIDSPTVVASVQTGRPNACNQCHLDKSLSWTQQYLQAWYGTPSVELNEDEQNTSAMVAWLLKGDAGQRALSAWSMGWQPAREASGEAWLAPYLATLLDDPYAAVRYIAQRSLRTSPQFSQLPYDFVGPIEQQTQLRKQLMAAWQAEYEAKHDKTGREILIDAAGRLDAARLERFLKRRDDRPIFLRE